MVLERLRRHVYDVLAVCVEGEPHPGESAGRRTCPVLSFLKDNKRDRQVVRMWALMTEFVPKEGPPLHNSLAAKQLREGICHFKRHPKKGKGVRVLWFRDGNRIICTEALFKRDDRLEDAIKRALVEKARYFEAKQADAITILAKQEHHL